MTLPNDYARCQGQPERKCCEQCRRRTEPSTSERQPWFHGMVIDGECIYRIAPVEEKK